MSELNDLFKQLAEERAKDPKYQKAKKLEEQVKESVKEDLGSLFSELASLRKKKIDLIEENPQLIEQVVETQEEVLVEVAPLPTPVGKVPDETQIPDIDKYLKPLKSDVKHADPLTNEFKQVNDKIKFLERWIGQIQNTGPGSGAAEIYNLDLPTKHVTGDYTIGRKDYYVGVNADVKTYITLPEIGSNVKDGRVVIIKDESGHAQLTPIKIVGIVDNDPNGAELRINNGALQLIYSNGCWRII